MPDKHNEVQIGKLHVTIDPADLLMQVTGKSRGKHVSDGEVSDKPIPERAETPRRVTDFKGLPGTPTNMPGMVSVNGMVMPYASANEWDLS